MKDWSLYLILGPQHAGGRSLIELARAAIAGGVTAVQLRDKEGTTRDLIRQAKALLEVTRPAGVPLIINDRLDVALATGADGVHVGQDDMPAPLVRQLAGTDMILGVSAENLVEAKQAEQDGANYLGVGDVYGTASKSDAGNPIGLKTVKAISRSVSIPTVGIGGITVENAPAVIQAGAVGVAVISAILGSEDVTLAAYRLREAIQQGHAAEIGRQDEQVD